jgi:hypothetical protein
MPNFGFGELGWAPSGKIFVVGPLSRATVSIEGGACNKMEFLRHVNAQLPGFEFHIGPDKRLQLSGPDGFHLEMSPELEIYLKLGVSWREEDYDPVYLYCNVVQTSRVNGDWAQFLAMAPTKEGTLQQVPIPLVYPADCSFLRVWAQDVYEEALGTDFFYVSLLFCGRRLDENKGE